MQYFYGDLHDPLIHFFIKFSGRIDENILKKAVELSFDAIPLIKCGFNSSSFNPFWEIKNIDASQTVNVAEGEKSASELLGSLASRINIFQGPQLKILLAKYEDGSDAVCAAINHMVCDGAGFKEYLYLLADIYTHLENDPDYAPSLGFGPRSIKPAYKSKSLFERIKLLFSKLELPKQNCLSPLPVKGADNSPFFATRTVGKEHFAAIRKYAKSKNSTLNDVFLAAYARLLAKELNLDEIVVPCPVDMRKYLPAGQKFGLCNLTLNYYCDIKFSGGDSFDEILGQVSEQISCQKQDDRFLKSLILLENISRVLRFKAFHKHFKKIFDVPMISYSNLGIIDKQKMLFGSLQATEAFLTGAVKHHPYFQISVSGFDGTCTVSSNMHAAESGKHLMEKYLDGMISDMVSAAAHKTTG